MPPSAKSLNAELSEKYRLALSEWELLRGRTTIRCQTGPLQ